MKQMILTILVLVTTLNPAFAAPTKKSNSVAQEIFSANKRDFNDRMYLYLNCLATTEFSNSYEKATERCSPVLNKSNALSANGLEERITADIKGLHKDIKDMISCLQTEASSTSNLSDSSAVSFCETMVKPTAGIEL